MVPPTTIRAQDNSLDTDLDTDYSTDIGSVVTDSYSEQETSTNISGDADIGTGSVLDKLFDGTTNSDVSIDNSSDSNTSLETITTSGNGISGSYSQLDVSSDSGTAQDTSSNTDGWAGATESQHRHGQHDCLGFDHGQRERQRHIRRIYPHGNGFLPPNDHG